MKTSELSGMSDVALVHKALELERQMMTSLLRHRLGRLEDSSVLRQNRRDIARIKTVLRARELEGGLPKGALESRHASTYQPQAAQPSNEGPGFLQSILDKQE